MKIVLITGATGLIGQEIVRVCHEKNWTVHYLTTSRQKLNNHDAYKGFYWNPKTNEIDSSCFEGVDTIINLVGASISKRWTPDYKNEIIKSRTATAKLLFDTIKTNNFPIEQIVSASAIGMYPSSQTNYYEEDFEPISTSFLGHVVDKWEDAIDQFSSLGIIVSKIRIGLVLSEDGGALPEIIKPMRFCAGAAFGNGQQWQSWIHIEDLSALFVYVADNRLDGIFNGVSPNPVSNSELTKIAAKVLKKPLVLPNIPKFVMKLILGDMHILLFESQRVSSQKIEEAGFNFTHHHLEPALEDLLG
ncbi:TIGR01777 family oxidoreductase [Psychroserpens ponticola]|uniref:TIGR01777 family oxidoreductase n=1 Tax=Psychroserpens ponticola TaxID=2932268 RepID=A0ABY7S134_9FLAO|nr:TIGR01777 family oxidoreductase [Psychroserpens ponticola]WCO02705.1 TIGR01777 family oxidoreductase [Psychroserpens ponticola]